MKPAPFHYLRATSVDEAVTWLHTYGSDAKLLAGGQSLLPVVNLRLARPRYVIDINRIPGLDGIRLDGDRLRVGGLVRHSALARSPLVQRHCPLLAEAARLIGHVSIRNRGTLGGSLAHADPAAELPTAALALGARITVRGLAQPRTVPAEEMFVSVFTTTLAEDELLTEVDFPVMQRREGWSLVEEARREGDFALIAAAAGVRLSAEGRIEMLRLVLGGAGDAPQLVQLSGAIGETARPGLWPDLAATAAAAADPPDDLHASAGLRRHLIRTLAERALAQAAERAIAQGGDDVG